MRKGLISVAALAAIAGLASCSREDNPRNPPSPPTSSAGAPPAAAPPASAPRSAGVRDLYTNVLGEDYVGPATCGKCHEKNYSSWKLHPHSRMNMLADEHAVLGDFNDARLPYADGIAVFRKEKGQYLMEYVRGGRSLRTFKITRTIGWRYLQEYVGIQTQGPEPAGDLLYSEETRLKFGYVLKERKWLPQSYFDAPNVDPEYQDDGRLRYDPYEPDRTPFNTQCIHCHNTFPYELRLFTSERLLGFPLAPPLAVESLLRDRPDHLDQFHNPYLPTRALVTVGISCESCHFGGREHAKDPKVKIRFVPTHPELADWSPSALNARKNPTVVNSICRQCHFSMSGTWADGSSLLNSMESIDQDRGACKSKLKCIDCHNPHVRGPDAGAVDRPEHLAACGSCHEKLRSAEAARAHGHHDPGQASCLDCHMPRIVQGFDVINRTHRISSPTEPEILSSGMPNACNLCHLDRSLAWTRDALEKFWGKRVELPPQLEEVFGSGHAKPAGEAWLSQPSGLLRSVAGAALARSRLGKAALPGLLRSLDEPNAYLRRRALENVEQVLGRTLKDREFVLTARPEERQAQVERLQKESSGR